MGNWVETRGRQTASSGRRALGWRVPSGPLLTTREGVTTLHVACTLLAEPGVSRCFPGAQGREDIQMAGPEGERSSATSTHCARLLVRASLPLPSGSSQAGNKKRGTKSSNRREPGVSLSLPLTHQETEAGLPEVTQRAGWGQNHPKLSCLILHRAAGPSFLPCSEAGD